MVLSAAPAAALWLTPARDPMAAGLQPHRSAWNAKPQRMSGTTIWR